MTVADRDAALRHRPAASVASLERIVWQRIELAGDGPVGAVVAGTRRRRPVQVRVDVDTALALAEAGVPTVARQVGASS